MTPSWLPRVRYTLASVRSLPAARAPKHPIAGRRSTHPPHSDRPAPPHSNTPHPLPVVSSPPLPPPSSRKGSPRGCPLSVRIRTHPRSGPVLGNVADHQRRELHPSRYGPSSGTNPLPTTSSAQYTEAYSTVTRSCRSRRASLLKRTHYSFNNVQPYLKFRRTRHRPDDEYESDQNDWHLANDAFRRRDGSCVCTVATATRACAPNGWNTPTTT